MAKLLACIFTLLCSSIVFAYTFSIGSYGEYPKWPSSISSLSIYYIPENSSSISNTDVYQIFNNSTSVWNSHGDIGFSLYSSAVNTPYSGRNEIYFSNSSSYFSGSGVVGVTQLIYKSGSGEIVEADIILNDSYDFSNDETNRKYLGNVVSHELGHVLGLGHSEVHSSTMFYQLSTDQHVLVQDDKSAVEVLYPPSVSSGSISGTVVGGDDLIGVFAAHVQAISRSTGKVAAGAFSDDDGTFTIGGLPLDDQYYVYVGPFKYLGAQTDYFLTARTNFCSGGGNYRGSFYESCYQDGKGRPNVISLNNSQKSQSLGNLTIKCDLSIPDELQLNSEMSIAITDDHLGGAVTDFFSVANDSTHRITFDLSGYAVTTDLYFDLKLISQPLYSTGDFKINVYLNKNYDDTLSDPDYVFDNADATTDLSLNQEFAVTDDLFTVEIVAEDEVPAGSLSDFFPDAANFADSYNFYLLSYGLKRSVGDDFSTIDIDEYEGDDNSYCPLAPNTYSVSANATEYVSQREESDDEVVPGISCGTIDFDDGSSGGGPTSLLFGFLLILITFGSKSILSRQY